MPLGRRRSRKMADEAEVDFRECRKQFKICLGKKGHADDVTELKEVWRSTAGGEVEKKMGLDQAFRDTIKDRLINDVGVESYKYVINLAIQAVSEGCSSPNLPFLLLSDVLDSVTLDLCDPLFTFVEERVSTWTKPLFFSAGKNLLLRMCNDLLRRLSTSQSTVFCGRIQLFLASLFPLSEKSGLNLMSQFNLENVTAYTQKTTDEQDKDTSSETIAMDVDDREAGEIAGGVPIDYNLYKKFWALQDFFRNPVQCYTPKRWKTFVMNTKEVLSVFSSHKLEHITWKKKAKEMMKDMTDSCTSSEDGSSSSDIPRYFSKFLTNEKLLDLQLSDSNFRRTILVQFLVLFQYLIGSVKFKSNNHVLTELQSLWVKETTNKVYQLIKETPPDGEKFSKTVEHVFEREENWISWKNEGCPSFTKERVSTSVEQSKKATQTRKRKRSIGEEVASSWRSKKVLMGSPELTRLWNLCPDNLEACKAENRVFLPTLEKFFEEAIDQADPEAMVEEEYKVIKDSNFGWRALRLLARRSQHFFQPSSNPFKTLPEYLQSVVQQLATELPVQNATKTEESGIVENGSCAADTGENLT